jgi:HlyD family secretion protein
MDMNTWKKKVLPVVGIVALIGLVVGGIAWSKRGQVKVQTGKVQTEDLSSLVTASGQIKPKNFANVNANSIGKVTDIYVKEGQQTPRKQP